MKLFKNVLTQQTLEAVDFEYQSLLDTFSWKVSDNFWGEEIKRGITGTVSSALVSQNLQNMIISDLKDVLPKNANLLIQHYIWHRHSGISVHNDHTWKFGSTLYLNKDWDIDWGGLFIWEDKESGLTKALKPEYNSFVLNENQEDHLVTAISPLAPYNRRTIQIWGRK